MSKLLITYHSFTGKTRTLAEAAAEGAKNAGAEVNLKEMANVTIQDLTGIDAILMATPQPFQMIAGESKKLFERLWRDRQQIGEGKPFGAIICHTNDPRPSVEAMEKLSGYYKFTKANDWITVNAAEVEAGKERCRQLGANLARTGKQTQS